MIIKPQTQQQLPNGAQSKMGNGASKSASSRGKALAKLDGQNEPTAFNIDGPSKDAEPIDARCVCVCVCVRERVRERERGRERERERVCVCVWRSHIHSSTRKPILFMML